MANHKTVSELIVGIYKKGSGIPSVTYSEAVDEALCFGWIDGVRRTVDAVSFAQRFTPRRKGSNWSAVNLKRIEELTQQGLMHASGFRVFEQRDQSAPPSGDGSHPALPEAYEALFRGDEAAWGFFERQAPWYRRISTMWVMDAKREETRERRLRTLIEDSAAGRWIKLVARPGER